MAFTVCPSETDHRWKLREDKQSFACLHCGKQVFELFSGGSGIWRQVKNEREVIQRGLESRLHLKLNGRRDTIEALFEGLLEVAREIDTLRRETLDRRHER